MVLVLVHALPYYGGTLEGLLGEDSSAYRLIAHIANGFVVGPLVTLLVCMANFGLSVIRRRPTS